MHLNRGGGKVSRLTYRESVTVCHQHTTREAAARDAEITKLFPRPPGVLKVKRSRVRRIGRGLAWKVISRYEWLGTMPMCSDYYGVFFDDHLAGVACYATGGAGVNVPKWLGAHPKKVAYLCRGACVHWAPKGTAPRLINRSADMTGCDVAIAYSDTDAGEIGTVYQASGWTCLGKGASTIQYISPQGRAYDQKLPFDIARKSKVTTRKMAHKALIRAGWTTQKSNPKYRYGKILDAGLSNQSLVQRFAVSEAPYPKRRPVEGATFPVVAGGADPTSALHLEK